MPTPDDDMSLREIARTLSDFRQEFRSQVAQLVRADVYRAELGAVVARVAALEKEREREEADHKADQRQRTGAFIMAAASLVVALIVAALKLGGS
jgi:hypothetical protein